MKNKNISGDKRMFHGLAVKPSGLYPDLNEISQADFDSLTKRKVIDFSNCHLIGVQLSDGEFRKTSFENSKFYCCYFDNATFTDCNFQNTSLTDCEFHGSSLKDCNFKNADISYTHFSESQLHNNSFQQATFRHSVFKQNSQLQENDFLIAKMNSVYFHDVESLNNRNLEHLSITMGGAINAEVDNHRHQIMDALNPSADNPERQNHAFHHAKQNHAGLLTPRSGTGQTSARNVGQLSNTQNQAALLTQESGTDQTSAPIIGQLKSIADISPNSRLSFLKDRIKNGSLLTKSQEAETAKEISQLSNKNSLEQANNRVSKKLAAKHLRPGPKSFHLDR